MSPVLKVFLQGAEQEQVADQANVIERYDGFVLVDASPASAKKLARTHLVEDITELYDIPVAAGEIDTSLPRIDAEGGVRSHPAYPRGAALTPGPHHYLVQFIGPIKDEWLTGVKRAGGEPRELYANFAYVVRADEPALEKIIALPYVRWVGHLSHEDRISSALRSSIAGEQPPALPRTELLPDVYTVEFFGPQDAAAAVPAVKKLGLKILAEEPRAKLLIVEARGTKAEQRKQIKGLSAVHGVRKIRQRPVNRPSNDIAAGIMVTAASMASPGLGLSGKGETIGICDTGLDTGDKVTIHPDFAGRVAYIKSYPVTSDFAPVVNNPGANDGAADLDSGHGTHVAGSVLGNGSASLQVAGQTAPIRGLAYNAKLVFQAVEQALNWKNPADLQRSGRYVLAGIPLDLRTLFADAYTKGVRIHSNSWGGGDPGAYDDQSRQLDQFVWDRKDFCIVVAAGNDGSDSDGDGKINFTSVTSPATAKNCITVGACENKRPNFDAETYGAWWPSDYPALPFRTDPMANNPDQVVAFSSRGPTKQNRAKPDLVAPGTFILSTRSTMIAKSNTAWAPFPLSRLYFFMGGTSMATPLVAGAVALLREYLRKKKSIANPSAALLKAGLIAGVTRLKNYGQPGAVLDNHQGFGRLSLDGILAPKAPATAQFADVHLGLRTGQVQSRTFKVKSNSAPLRFVLAYTDAPGASIVNNLNLVATAPDGRKFAGNQRKSGPATFDGNNNAELIQVDKPAAGTWVVDVVGSNVPSGPQDYALVAVGHF